MKNCSVCRNAFEINDRIIASHKETFIFNIKDPARPELNDGIDRTKTEIATSFITFDGNELDPKYFNVRHIVCSRPIPQGTSKIFSKDPIVKHSIRFTRTATKTVNGREVHKH